MTSLAIKPRNTKERILSTVSRGLACVLAAQLAFFPAAARGAASTQDQQKEPLGSLSIIGGALVNGSQPPAESTIFSGDSLRTGADGTATFTTGGKGSLKIFPASQVEFPGNPQFMADLKAGTAVMSSQSGSTGISVRAGKSVVVAVTAGEQSTSKIEAAADGSFLITCLDGSVGVIPLEGANGLFIQAGQFVSISPTGDLNAVEKPPARGAPPTPPAPSTPTTQTTQTSSSKNTHVGWIILAVAGGVGAAVAAAKAGGGGGAPAVSQSSQ